MNVPSISGIVLLVYLFLVLPLSSYRSARRLRSIEFAPENGSARTSSLTPARIYQGTLLSLALTFYLSWLVAHEIGFNLFAIADFGRREFLISVAFFVASFGVGLLSRAIRREQELLSLPVMKLIPRTRNDWIAFLVVALTVGVAEESAYRGMATVTLAWTFGNMWLAVFLSSVAFAFAHWLQGSRSMAIIFVKGLLMQGMVQLTGTLVGAMIAHSLLDIITAYRTHKYLERNESTPRVA